MSAYPAPTQNLPIFSSNEFSVSDSQLTIGELTGQFLQFPLAQPQIETIPNLVISASGTAPTAASSSNDTTIATTAMVQAAIAAALALTPTIPAGTITAYGGHTTAPTGWLFCNGNYYTNGSFPALYAAIGITYGTTGTEFAVPNLLGRNAKGAAATTINTISYNPQGTSNNVFFGGSSTILDGQIPEHYHTTGVPVLWATDGNYQFYLKPPSGEEFPDYSLYKYTNRTAIDTLNNTPSGYEHYEPFVVVQYIIKT